MSLTRKVISSLAIVCLSLVCVSAVSDALAQQVPQSLERTKVSTPMTPMELLATLRQAHIDQFGSPPSRSRLAMAWAQVALENAHGAVMWNHNVGNVGPGRGDTWYQHSPKARYRSFENFIDGAKVYWRVVAWCSAAFRMFDAGQPATATENLKRCGYFEADLEPYVKGMTSLYYHAIQTVIPQEERERRERQEQDLRAADYERRTLFSPRCACCVTP